MPQSLLISFGVALALIAALELLVRQTVFAAMLMLLVIRRFQLRNLTIELGHLGAPKGQHLLGCLWDSFFCCHGLEQSRQLADVFSCTQRRCWRRCPDVAGANRETLICQAQGSGSCEVS